MLAIEVKWTDNPRYQHAEGLRSFLDAHPNAQGGILLHRGTDVRYLHERIRALPWTLFAR
jgi:hypothetical protein